MPINSYLYNLVKYFFYLSIFLLSYNLFYNQVFLSYPSDLPSHIGFIPDIIKGTKFLPHPLFHYITYFIAKSTTLTLELSAILVNSFLIVFLAITIHIIIHKNIDKDVNKYLVLLLVFIVLYSGTPHIPWLHLTQHFYIGTGSISVWHNVTIYMVKPFAFISFFLFFYVSNTFFNKKLLVISLFSACISIFAKPSFIVVFLPIVILYTFYMYFKQNQYLKYFIRYSLILLAFSIFILGEQYLNTYQTSNSKVVLAPLLVWSYYSKNIFMSIIISNLFVFSFSILNFKYLSERSTFSLIMLSGGILLFALFAESGDKCYDANFSWSYIITQQIAYLSVLLDFINNYQKIQSLTKQRILYFVLMLHIVFGLIYFTKIFLGGSYL